MIFLRCEKAVELLKSSRYSRAVILTLSAGTAHVPNLQREDGKLVLESQASAEYLMKHLGVPKERVFFESTR